MGGPGSPGLRLLFGAGCSYGGCRQPPRFGAYCHEGTCEGGESNWLYRLDAGAGNGADRQAGFVHLVTADRVQVYYR